MYVYDFFMCVWLCLDLYMCVCVCVFLGGGKYLVFFFLMCVYIINFFWCAFGLDLRYIYMCFFIYIYIWFFLSTCRYDSFSNPCVCFRFDPHADSQVTCVVTFGFIYMCVCLFLGVNI